MFHVFRDDARRRLTGTLTGAVSFGEAARFLNAQRSQGAWNYGVLYDATAMTALIADEDMQLLADHSGRLNQSQTRGPIAIAGTLDGLAAYVERYAAMVKPAGILVEWFADIAAADHWLRTLEPAREPTT